MRYKLGGLAVLVVGVALVSAGIYYWSVAYRSTELRLPGIVEIQEVRLGPRISGRVGEVFVREGDEVNAGQELIRLEVPELEAQRNALQARVQAAEADYEQVTSGSRAQEKEMAAMAALAARMRLVRLERGYREEDKRQAASELEAVKADERMAIEEFGRVSRLYRQGVGSRTEYDTWQTNLDRARGKVAVAMARNDQMLTGSRSEDIQEARAEFRRLDAQRDLILAGPRSEERTASSARLAEARAKLEEVEANLRESVVRAAEPSTVEIVSVRKGDLVQASQPIVRVLRRSDLWVKTYVPETELGKVQLGQTVKVRMDSYSGVWFEGKVTHIGNESEFTPRNIQTVDERRHQMFGIRVRIEDPKGHFKSGMAADVLIPVDGVHP